MYWIGTLIGVAVTACIVINGVEVVKLLSRSGLEPVKQRYYQL